ncbi:peptidylprolyl isomerase [Salinarimonas soli]|uniref:Parvulin-like PPIase n=1 Tax=Salinarimonas soli TaxID=1638099 RepID=A0A5B2VYP3_9HYPH|nr:peptidylprolyl isomerase [Salinarimonas soli]KAA2243934.1 peptidylprolyl isomerase [Salinarimonas soli]
MMQGLRKAGQSWLGKIVVAVLFGLLIVSFAIWGINDIFRGGVRTAVAKVGDVEISADTFRTAYQAEIQRLQRQTRQSITPDRARALGLDQRVLARLISEAALNQRANTLNLAASDELVARSVREDEGFRGPNGTFDRNRFNEILRDNNLSEQAFVREQRSALARLQLADALTAALPVPMAAREAVHRYGAERRTTEFAVLPATAAGEIPAPSEEQLRAFHEERKTTFRAPEYRAISALVLTPETLVRPEAVSEADARARYEQVKGARFGTAERRTIEQIVFPDPAEAQAVAEQIKSGALTFEAAARERNIDPASLALGTFAKGELIDQSVADAAFALPKGGVSDPVQGRFGTVLLRVADVLPESVRPFEEVADQVRRELATERARTAIAEVHDQIEDQRAGARPLLEIAKEKGLSITTIPAVDRAGLDKAGKPVLGLPEREAVLNAAFASDIGVDNEALRTRDGGYVWYDVTGIEPARDRSFEEVRADVEAQWRADEIARRLRERATAMVERIEKGEAFAAVASEAGADVQTADDLARGTPKGELTGPVVAQIFATPVGKTAQAALDDGRRVVFRPTAATVPPYLSTAQASETVENQLRTVFTDDVLSQYISRIQTEVGVSINQDALRRAVGGEA